MRKIYVITFFVVASFLAAYLLRNRTLDKVTINGHTYYIEIANTVWKQTVGFMFRPYIHTSRGILFEFPYSGKHVMWMKNTLVPLDIIWLDENFYIVHIEKNAATCLFEQCKSYYPQYQKAKYVLELRGGQIDDKNINPGDKLEYFP